MELGSADIVSGACHWRAAAGAGGGGGGGGGGSFLQPAAKTAKNTLSMISAT